MKLQLILTGKQRDNDKFEEWYDLKFEAPERTPQDGLATRDALAHLHIRVTKEQAEALAPALFKMHAEVHPGQPEVFLEGRSYTLELTPEAYEPPEDPGQTTVVRVEGNTVHAKQVPARVAV